MHGTKPLVEDQPICADTWREKYRYRDEPDYAATCARVIGALCGRESEEFRQRALAAMLAREVVPAGRILAGAGTDKRVTWINCYVSDDIQDSMRTDPGLPGRGIMDALARAAYTQQMGGGIGMNFSTIRPRGAKVFRTDTVSSGVLPFMDMWDAMCATIRSSGSRRGAQMGTLGVWHPDIEEFIGAKQRPGRLTNFNISVMVTEDFMRAVEEDAAWHLTFPVPPADLKAGLARALRDRDAEGPFHYVRGEGATRPGSNNHFVYKVIRARELWGKITAATYVYAEPGVIFIDRVNQQNNLAYCEEINCSNPCGEQMLPATGACNLGHTNLAVMVDRPFESDAAFRFDKLDAAARIMVRLLDNVLDLTPWPLEEQAEEARNKRRIGLGFTGLASALQQLGIPYGSDEAVEFTRRVAKSQAGAAYAESIELAKERGAFPLFDRDKFLAAPFVRRLPGSISMGIREHGIRNGVLLSIAPTGTTSLAVGNVSSGIEPVFAHRYRRRVRGDSGEMENEYSVYDYGYLKYCEKFNLDPEVVGESIRDGVGIRGAGGYQGFVTADQLTVEQHLQMAAAAQEWVDSAISKTINCPESMPIEEFRQVYARAYDLGLKGCTTYRPDKRSGRGAVLVAEAPATPAGEEVRVPNEQEEGSEGRAEVSIPQPPECDRRQAGQEAEVTSAALSSADKIPMQDVVEGRRYRIKWPAEDCAYYVVITDYVDPRGRRRPFELFISTKSERHSEWVKAFSLLVTAIFRREGDPSFVVDELRSVFSAQGGSWVRVPWQDKPKLATSLVAAIGLKIEEHMRWLGVIGADEVLATGHTDLMVPPETIAEFVQAQEPIMPAQDLMDICDQCGARAVIYAEGCATCHACGRSDCG
ncbi:adenosylcobalamin-dependent ribonucleoside-diphosphate reductase [bacterium]|nr:adenosylcobalamin-dependent ribonucleoside-diphosphate reductase [bacterium]